MSKMSEKFRLPLVSIVAALLVTGLALTAWFIRPQEVMEEASESLAGNRFVQVREVKIGDSGGFLVEPVEKKKNVSMIFYPGARVPAKAYLPTVFGIAEEGYEVFLVKMPLNLAILGWKKAGKIIAAGDTGSRWVIAGHSMGGAMAARFVSRTDYSVDGLVLWASYPPRGAEFSSRLKVLSITADRDEIIDEDNVLRSRNQFPENSEFFEIEGGNHSQFGWYGFQSGDGRASISRDRQTELIVEVTNNFLEEL